MEKWTVCGSCHIAFKGNNNVCPSCGKTIVDEKNEQIFIKKVTGENMAQVEMLVIIVLIVMATQIGVHLWIMTDYTDIELCAKRLFNE